MTITLLTYVHVRKEQSRAQLHKLIKLFTICDLECPVMCCVRDVLIMHTKSMLHTFLKCFHLCSGLHQEGQRWRGDLFALLGKWHFPRPVFSYFITTKKWHRVGITKVSLISDDEDVGRHASCDAAMCADSPNQRLLPMLLIGYIQGKKMLWKDTKHRLNHAARQSSPPASCVYGATWIFQVKALGSRGNCSFYEGSSHHAFLVLGKKYKK